MVASVSFTLLPTAANNQPIKYSATPHSTQTIVAPAGFPALYADEMSNASIENIYMIMTEIAGSPICLDWLHCVSALAPDVTKQFNLHKSIYQNALINL